MCHSKSFLTQHLSGARAAYFFLPFVSAFFLAGFLATDFFAALFLGAALFFAAVPEADASAASAAAGAAFFPFFAGSSGAVKRWPLKAISVILTAVKGWRCPYIFLYCFLRL